MANKIKKFLNEEVFEPALASGIEDKYKRTIKGTRTKMSHFQKSGDLYCYLSKVLMTGDKEKMPLYKAIKEEGLLAFEDVYHLISEKFKNEIKDFTHLEDLVIGQLYSKIEVCVIANNFNQFQGMREVFIGNEVVAMIAEIKMMQGKYLNEWIDKDRVLKYYPQTIRGKGLPQKTKIAINNKNLPFYIFINTEPQSYQFTGVFYNKETVQENEQLWLKLEKSNSAFPIPLIESSLYWKNLDAEVKRSSLLTEEERLEKIKNWKSSVKYRDTKSRQLVRNPHLKTETIIRAKGKCGDCKSNAPFISKSTGLPYLEAHHIKPISKGGDDNLENMIALCPNCHRERHFGIKK